MMNFAALAGGRQWWPLQPCPMQEQLRCPPWEEAPQVSLAGGAGARKQLP